MVDMSTTASNPARVRINLLHYARCHPTDAVIAIIMVSLGVLGSLAAGHPAVLILAGAGVLYYVQAMLTARAKFVSGDVCPAKVLSDSPYTIAVATDLTTGGRQRRPAVLIKRVPLERMAGGPPVVGSRIATVALYHGNARSDAWSQFDPTVLACATNDLAAIERVTRSIPAAGWQNLDQLLSRLPDKRVGLYKLWISTDNTFVTGGKKIALTLLVFGALAVPLCAIAFKAASKRTAAAPQSTIPQSTPTNVTPPAPRPVPPPPRPPVHVPSPKPALGPKPESIPTDPQKPSRSIPAPPQPPTPAAPTASRSAFTAGQKLEAREKSGQWSAATIKQVDDDRYFVHYDGWSDSWDEWVTADRLRPVAASGGVFDVGQAVDIHEKRVRWTPGTVIKKEGRRYRVHYDGWSDQWDEWVGADQLRLRSAAIR